MRTCLANARQNLGVRALKCPRLKDSSNPFTILQKEKEHCASVLFLLSIHYKKDVFKFLIIGFELLIFKLD